MSYLGMARMWHLSEMPLSWEHSIRQQDTYVLTQFKIKLDNIISVLVS